MANIDIRNKTDMAKLKRHALAAQGLLQSQPFGRGMPGARKAIDHVGYVQIDTISVVERAHHHVVRSRVPNFNPAMTNKLLKDRSIFEYWSHAAAFLPMRDYRYSLPYKQAIKNGKIHWFRSRDEKLMAQLLDRVTQEGALRSRDVEEAKGDAAGWWDWKPAKKALDQLYMQGDLMITDREGFQKSYDLPERVLPATVNTQMPTYMEFAEHMLDQQLRCHGFATLKGITYQRRNPELRSAMKTLVNARLAAGDLDTLTLPSGEYFYTKSGLLDQTTPRAPARVLIMSPFDNAIIQRERLNALFNFDYQIECYVPEDKRRYGYFCLPLLYRDEFVGRMDCKAHRKSSHLEVRSLHIEDGAQTSPNLMQALADAILEFSTFQDCATASVTNSEPKSWRTPLNRLLN